MCKAQHICSILWVFDQNHVCSSSDNLYFTLWFTCVDDFILYNTRNVEFFHFSFKTMGHITLNDSIELLIKMTLIACQPLHFHHHYPISSQLSHTFHTLKPFSVPLSIFHNTLNYTFWRMHCNLVCHVSLYHNWQDAKVMWIFYFYFTEIWRNILFSWKCIF